MSQPQTPVTSEVKQTERPLASDLRDEAYREYDFGGRVYRIDGPVTPYSRPGGTTHRVLDVDGVVHCFPAPGFAGCVLRWKPLPGKPPVAF